MRFYLIQRGTFRTFKDDKVPTALFGTSDTHLIEGDYMGAAEFEFGAIPKAYRRIMYDFDQYEMFDTGLRAYNDVPLWLFAKKDMIPEIIETLVDFIKHPEHQRLHEWTNLPERFKTPDPFDIEHNRKMMKKYPNWTPNITNFWWEIDWGLDWMLFTGGQDRVRMFQETITKDHDEWWIGKHSEEEREEMYYKALN